MPSSLTHPGVYIEEIPSGVRTITGVATSITAFVGSFPRGPLDRAVRVFSWGEFERHFGGLAAASETSYAIQQFFLNGGSQAYVVRVGNKTSTGDAPARSFLEVPNTEGGAALMITAANEGEWGDSIRVEVDYNTLTPTRTFNMTVLEVEVRNGRETVKASERLANLEMNAGLAARIEGESALIRVTGVEEGATNRPRQTGTTSGVLPDLAGVVGELAMDVTPSGASRAYSFTIDMDDLSRPSQLASALQVALRKVRADAADDFDLSRATVTVIGDAASERYIKIVIGDPDGPTSATLVCAGVLATAIGVADVVGGAVRAGVQRYALTGGSDGAPPGASSIVGADSPPRTGIYALRDVDLFNILAIPDTMAMEDTEAESVFAAATVLAQEERAFYILDIPQPPGNPRDKPTEIEEWIGDRGSLRDRNVATYYPRPRVADPLDRYLLRSIAASGTVAGMYARTDTMRGVWKAPAGADATLRGVSALEYLMTDAENGVVNPLGVNALRSLPVIGRVLWGARTLVGADALANEWKYVPVRRTALFIEESLFRGLQWVVFEPNDEPLWASIRLNVGAFMQSLFRQGAFQGASPSEAYLVKCDAETTTQTDIDSGIVNIVVGFAPLKPAEFVVLKIQQLTSQSEA